MEESKLSQSQIQERLLKPEKAIRLQAMKRHQSRLAFHTTLNLKVGLDWKGAEATRFLDDFVKNLLSEDKFQMFKHLFRYPVPTNGFVDEMYRELQRVFAGRNASSTLSFNNTKDRDDCEYYLQDVLGFPKTWEYDIWEASKHKPNSLLVIDLPKVQKSTKPEPYYYILDIESVIDYDYDNQKGVFEWVMFRTDENELAFFDAYSVRVFKTREKSPFQIESLVHEGIHNLGYTPVTSVLRDSIDLDTKEFKVSPLTKELSNLDWYLFQLFSKRQLDLYAAYPIYSGYARDCDYESSAARCDGGFLRGNEGNYMIDGSGELAKCPACKSKIPNGAGSYIEIPMPDGENIPDLRNPITITPADIDSLKYNVDESERLRNAIFTSVTGIGGGTGVIQKASVTSSQVEASFDSKTSVINDMKVTIEALKKFTTDTICRLRYGSTYLSCSHDLGNEFYLKTTEDLYKKYKTAKENGASEAELEMINEQIVEVEHKNNPLQLQRIYILKHLEPYRHLSVDEVLGLYGKGLADELSVMIKVNFNSYINRFERENLNITEFGINTDFNTKINNIKKELESYGNEQINSNAAGRASNQQLSGASLPAQAGGGELLPRQAVP